MTLSDGSIRNLHPAKGLLDREGKEIIARFLRALASEMSVDPPTRFHGEDLTRVIGRRDYQGTIVEEMFDNFARLQKLNEAIGVHFERPPLNFRLNYHTPIEAFKAAALGI